MKNEYYIMGHLTWNPGFFSSFQAVISFLDFIEKENPIGYYVSFEGGLYFDKNYGNNWWEYYFQPIKFGDFNNQKINHIGDSLKAEWAGDAISKISRERASYLINKFIKLQPNINNKIENFIQNNFKDKYVIGVHYRGTDKSSEAPRVSYDDFIREINNLINKNNLQNFVIFIATDENNFINYAKQFFNEKIVYTDSIRSNNYNPIHHFNGVSTNNAYKLGEDAVIDCFLLSKSSIMIRNHSNLSSSAANINCNLQVINLNHATYSKKNLR